MSKSAGVACVDQIQGDACEVFDRLDADKNGVIDHNELKSLLTRVFSSQARSEGVSVGDEDQDAVLVTDDHVSIVAQDMAPQGTNTLCSGTALAVSSKHS